MENLLFCVHTVIKSLNLEISLAVWQASSKKRTYLNACHTCRMIIFLHLTILMIVSWHYCFRCHGCCYNFLIWVLNSITKRIKIIIIHLQVGESTGYFCSW